MATILHYVYDIQNDLEYFEDIPPVKLRTAPRKRAAAVNDPCGVQCPDLPSGFARVPGYTQIALLP